MDYPSSYLDEDETNQNQTETSVNINPQQRNMSLVGGAVLLAAALARRGLPGLGLGAAGATLLYQGSTGMSPINRLLGKNQAVHNKRAAISVPHQQGKHISHSITINRPAEELYRFWRDFSNLPQIMPMLESVEVASDTHSRWTVNGPAGIKAEWETEIINDEPHTVIGWRSLQNPYVDHAGAVRFKVAPVGQGTEVSIQLEYMPVGGVVSMALIQLLGKSPEYQVAVSLYRLKQLMELGEITSVEGQPSGRAKSNDQHDEHDRQDRQDRRDQPDQKG